MAVRYSERQRKTLTSAIKLSHHRSGDSGFSTRATPSNLELHEFEDVAPAKNAQSLALCMCTGNAVNWLVFLIEGMALGLI